MPRSRSSSKNNSTANLGFEAKLSLASNKSGQDKPARGKRRFGLANRARRVRLVGGQPKQSNPTTRRLAVMNLALRGIEADFGPEHADTFRRDLHPDLRADYVLANPPFNPAACGTNFAWVQHFILRLAPHGMAGFVLANGSISSNQSGEGTIRQALIEADLVDCMVALPGQLFYSTLRSANTGSRLERAA
jgi:hypothetical protein